MKRRSIACVLFLIAAGLIANSMYAQEPSIDYKQLVAKCSEAIKQARSYKVKMEYKNSFTISSQEKKSNFVELNTAFISPDRFKVTQIINEGSSESLWDGWVVIGDDYYVFNPGFGWAKEDDDNNRRAMCKACSPEGIVKQLEGIEKGYKRDSIRAATKDGAEYFVIKYSFGKESVNTESLPPELKDSTINGTYEIWIHKNNYLPFKQSEEVSYYLNEHNKGTSSTNTNYFSYNDDAIKIDEPAPDGKTF